MSKNKLVKDNYFEIETVDTGPTCFLEEDVYIPEEFVRNRALIRVDMNIVQFPIFSKNTKRKKNEITTYFFNKNKDIFITVTPAAGDLIPGEAEERIFIALMKIMKEKGMEQEFIATAREIKEAAKINTNNYLSDIKKAISRLSKSNYTFKNTMYSNELGIILSGEINTPILTYKSQSEIPLGEIKKIKNTINDNRIKEFYLIKISDHFYKNIVKRGYLVYDSDILLDINSSIARTLYMLLEKIRFDSLCIRESIFALIKKIPLKYEKRSLPVTIKTLEKAFSELKAKNLIKDFKFLKETTWLEADVEIYYSEEHNILKKERFEDDNRELKEIYNSLAISFTEKNIKELKPEIIINDEMINEIIELMPDKAKKLKSICKTVEKNLEKYGYAKVKAAAIYLSAQKKLTSPRAYFLKILENNWANDLVEEIVLKNEKNIDIKLEDEKPANINNENKELIFSEFEKLPREIQDGIEGYVYREYIKLCGMETKIQQIAFLGSRKKLICDYLEKYPELLGNIKKEEIKKIKVQEINEQNENLIVITDKDKLKKYINEYIDLYEDLLDEKIESLENAKKRIILDCMPAFLNKMLTLENLEEIIRKNLI
ncbi:replication initiator protein A [Cetobacterium sp. 8H]|uniref:replication initiator protein A n=1 Tax=Cetobacterium sp. 8H TaxID=2759681 RepID=UPI00163D2ABB|nr:replication initiator protein A [Cetobacterium sp. 8H]MBC2849978.1 replication initiator protein A [Cetobacterium sp. 8H]